MDLLGWSGSDAMAAVVPPCELDELVRLVGHSFDDARILLSGCSKYAVFLGDTVYVFPRHGHDDDVVRGTLAASYLAEAGVATVARVLNTWSSGVSVCPFTAFERRNGRIWQRVESTASFSEALIMIESLGQAVGTWHRLPLSALPASLRQAPRFLPKQPWLLRLLDPIRLESSIHELGVMLGVGRSWLVGWQRLLMPIAEMHEVFLHGDITENNLLIDGDCSVTSVLDWDSSGVGHPLLDFDFGEWGKGIFRWEDAFGELRQAMWRGYASTRGGNLPSAEQVHLLFTLSELAYFEDSLSRGRIDDWGLGRLSAGREAIRSATIAAGL